MKKILPFIIVNIALFADSSAILSNTKQQIIELQKQQVIKKESSNKYDWITNINLNGTINKNQDDITTNDYSLNISQDIFKFGGITSQIEYANELKKLEMLNLQINTNSDLNTLYSLLIDIKSNQLTIEQNILNVKNSTIDINNKTSEYKAGELSISDLNDAIMTKNKLIDAQKALQLSKLLNINSIKKFTNVNYNTIKIPNVKLMSKNIFLENENSLKSTKSEIKVNNSLYSIKKSDYLPTLSVNGKYGYNDTSVTSGDDYYNYGIALSVPLSFTSSSNIEQTKLNYLIKKQELEDQLNSVSLVYDEAILTIKNYEDRINLALEDIKLYEKLLLVNEEEYQAGYKTIDDVTTLNNSKLIRLIDIKLYQLQIQKQILKLYFKI